MWAPDVGWAGRPRVCPPPPIRKASYGHDVTVTRSHTDVWWLPVGAGSGVAVRTSRAWELIQARRGHRAPQPLFHTALEVRLDGVRWLIEMASAWSGPGATRGVVSGGPVGAVPLGCSRLFRYEVRRWREGVLPDRRYAVRSPVAVALTEKGARALLDRVPQVPVRTWGRDYNHDGDMWNSNSLTSWLLATSGVDAARLYPPLGGRVPGWCAGIIAAGSPLPRQPGACPAADAAPALSRRPPRP